MNDRKIPDRSIGRGQYISDIQWENLFEDWTKSVARIISVIKSADLEHADQQKTQRTPDASVNELKEHLSRRVFLKLYPPINSFQDHYIGYGLDKDPPQFDSMKQLIYGNLQENLEVLSEELIVAWINIGDTIQLGDVPLADIQLLQIIEALLTIMIETTGEQSFIPDAIKNELPPLKDNYKLWRILSGIVWDTNKAAELLKIVLHFNRNIASEILSSEKFNSMIEEFENGEWWNGLHRRLEFFEKMSWEIFKVRL